MQTCAVQLVMSAMGQKRTVLVVTHQRYLTVSLTTLSQVGHSMSAYRSPAHPARFAQATSLPRILGMSANREPSAGSKDSHCDMALDSQLNEPWRAEPRARAFFTELTRERLTE